MASHDMKPGYRLKQTRDSTRLRAVLVAHTHWDREWYLSLEQLRPRLLRLFENLRAILETEPEYHSFWLDGQTIILHDYWETLGTQPRAGGTEPRAGGTEPRAGGTQPRAGGTQPEWLEKALVNQKILVGPWYTLVDEWLTSGEAIIRNLLEGQRTMRAYSQDNRIGYLPDAFGHISQMPAILAGFGIDNAFLFRGLREDELPCVEFEWVSAGGAQVRGIHLAPGYFNAQRIDAQRHLAGGAVDDLVKSIRDLEKRAASGALLLMNGVDQALPTHQLSRSIAILGELLPELDIQHASLRDYLALVESRLPQVNPVPVVRGELSYAPQLDGALSARVEQKIANRLVENLLTYYVEPLFTMVQPERRQRYRGMLRRAWALTMQCHSHDSISSCHSDLVAADMLSRLSQARQLGESLEQELLVEVLGTRPNEQSVQVPSTLLLRNPLPWDWNRPIQVTLDIPAGVDPQGLVFEQEGEPTPVHLLGRDEICRWTEHYYGKVHNKEAGTQHLQILIQPRLEAGAFGSVLVKERRTSSQEGEIGEQRPAAPTPHPTLHPSWLIDSPNVLDNGVIRVVVQPDGRLDITDLSTGRQALGLNRIVDEVDRGDLYEHARNVSGLVPPGRDFVPPVRGFVQSPGPGTVQVTHQSQLRAVVRVHTDIECNGVVCPLALDIALAVGSRWVEVSAALDNRSTDHWLRMTCPVPGTLRKLQAHTPFDLAERGLRNGAPYVDGNRIRFAQSLGQPMQWGLFASADQGLLGILNRGLYEYVYEDEGYLSISLMRFVGLIRSDLTSYSAQQANRPGVQRVEYALGFWPEHQITQALRAMVEYNLPPRCVQVFGPPPGLPRARLGWSNPYWMPSAWKPTEEGNGTLLRFWNASDVAQEGVVEYEGGMEGAMLARLDETPIRPLPPLVRAGPKEIVTILCPHSGKP